MSGVARHLVLTALDALGDGDQALAADVLLAGLEYCELIQDLDQLGPPLCPVCAGPRMARRGLAARLQRPPLGSGDGGCMRLRAQAVEVERSTRRMLTPGAEAA